MINFIEGYQGFNLDKAAASARDLRAQTLNQSLSPQGATVLLVLFLFRFARTIFFNEARLGVW